MDKDLILKLREKTGAGMMDCKKALIEADWDMELAQCYLKLLSQPLARYINVRGVKRRWENADYLNEARRILGKMYRSVTMKELFKLKHIATIKIGCIYLQNNTKKIGIISSDTRNGERRYYLGEESIQTGEATHKHKNIGDLILDLKDKIEEEFVVLRFEFLNLMTEERFGIDSEEIEEGRCGER